MKRKLALLMAAVMTLSMLPSMNVFAATGQTLSVTPNTVAKRSVLFEEGVYQATMGQKSGPVRGRDVNTDVEYAVDGTDLILSIYGNGIKVGDRFSVSLENAKFFFRGDAAVSPFTLDAAKRTRLNILNPSWGINGFNGSESNEKWARAAVTNATIDPAGNGNATNPAPFTNYNPAKGIWQPTATGAVTGSYVRFGSIAEVDKMISTTSIDPVTRFNPRLGVNVGRWDVGAYVRSDNPAAGRIVTPGTAAALPLIDLTTVGALYTQYTDLITNVAAIAAADRADYDATIAALSAAIWYEFEELYRDRSTALEIPYVMQTETSTDTTMVVEVLASNEVQTTLNSPYSGDLNWRFRIPMVVRTTDTGDVKATVHSSTGPVSTGTISLFSQTTAGTASTKAYADDYVTARTDFTLETLFVKETRLYSIANTTYRSNTIIGLDRTAGTEYSGTFTLQAPSGFEWKDPNELLKTGSGDITLPADRIVNLGVEAGLSWFQGPRFGPAATATPLAPLTGVGRSGTYNNGGTLGGIYGNYSSTDRDAYTAPYSIAVNGLVAVTPHNDYRIFYKNQGLTTEDRSILVVELYNVMPSTDLMGKLYITGLGLTADETAKLGDVLITIKDDRTWSAGVSDETFKVGVRAEWDIILKTISDIPTLVNGRYNKVDPLQAYDKDHKTARVQFEEQSVNAWWSDRKTEFVLPDWAKFRMVDFINDEFKDNRLQQTSINTLYKTVYTSNLATTASRDGNIGNGIYINDNVKHGAVTINGNVMTLENLKVQTDQRRAKLVMDMWISIESGKTGDVQLTVSGSAIPVQSNGGGVAPVTIARAVNPVNVTSKVTDIKIGYQYQPTFDILITETAPAMLEKGKDVYVSVSDLMSTDMLFSPDTKVAVTGGNLKIKSINNTVAVGPINVAAGATVLAGTGGTVTFNVDMASSVASTVTISNASVKVDRTVPETNKYPYKVIAWGPAVAPNYVYYEYNKDVRDKFPTAGIMADYLKVISSANDKSSILTQEVHVTIGETFFTVNGVSYDMDAAAYISTASNSTMVPVRFIANAFGISNEQVIWDDAKRTVTVVLPSRVIQFTVDSSTMLLDGSAVTMYSPDKLEVMAEIVGDRCYVPFRAMGEAFGVKVEWDDATQTAIYNPGASSNVVAAADETTATTAQ